MCTIIRSVNSDLFYNYTGDVMNKSLQNHRASNPELGYLCQLIHIYNTHIISTLQPEKAIAFTLSSGGWLFNRLGSEPIYDNTGTVEQLIATVEALLSEECQMLRDECK